MSKGKGDADIRIRVRENAREAVTNIRREFSKIKNLTSGFNIEDNGDIQKTKNDLRKLSRRRTVQIDPKVSRVHSERARKEIEKLQRKSTANGRNRAFDGGHQAFHGWRDQTRGPIDRSGKNDFSHYSVPDLPLFDKNGEELLGISAKDFDLKETRKELNKHQYRRLRNSQGQFTGESSTGLTMSPASLGRDQKSGGDGIYALPGGGITNHRSLNQTKQQWEKIRNRIGSSTDSFDGFNWKFEEVNKHARTFGNNVRKYTPNIMMWWKVVAILLPMMIMLRITALGVGAAMYTIVGAGAAILGLGLIGHGEGIADSFGLATRQLNKFKRELFQTFKPALAEFAPISWEFIEQLPSRLSRFVEPLRNLTIFENSAISMFEMALDFIEKAAWKMIGYADVFDQLAHRFGYILGDEILSFLDFVIHFAKNEQATMIELIEVFKAVLSMVYNLLKFAVYFMAVLRPLFDLLSGILDLFSNKWGAVLGVALVSAYLFIGVLNTLAGAIITLHILAATSGPWAMFSAGILGATASISGYIVALGIAIKQMISLHMLMGGLGLLAAGAGAWYAHGKLTTDADEVGASNRGGGVNSGGQTTINNEFHVHGDGARDAGRELRDKFPGMYEEQQTQTNSQDMGI